MRAKMSTQAARQYLDLTFGAYTEHQARDAEREARAILAETESGDGTHQAARYMSARTLTHGTLLSVAQAALAESLAAFVS